MGLLRRPRLSIRAVAIGLALAACVAREVQLSQVEQASTIALTNYDFGDQQIYTTSAPHTFTIYPTSGQVDNDTVNSVTWSCPDFSIVALGLPAMVTQPCAIFGSGGVCTELGSATTYSFTATFTPSFLGASGNCTVTVTIDNEPQTFNMTGTGVAPPIEIQVTPQTPPADDFGEVRTTTTSNPLTVTVQDVGSAQSGLTVNSVSFDPASIAAGFEVTGNTGQHVVTPGSDDDYSVTCTPAGSGTVDGTLTIASNDPATPTATVAFTCTGIVSFLDIDPSPAAIAGTQAGSATRVGEPVDIPFVLTNTGSASLTIVSLSASWARSGNNDLSVTTPINNLVLDSLGSAPVTVRYAPTQPEPGGTLGQLNVQITDTTTYTQSAAISGAAYATTMAFTGTNLGDFGPVCVGAGSSQTFTILANQAGSFDLIGVAQPDAPFTLAAVSPPQLPTASMPTFIPGGNANSAEFEVTAMPTAAGSATGSFTFDTDIPAGSANQTIPLTVLGLPPGVTGSPDMVDFGVADIKMVSTGQTVTVTNCGSAALQLSAPMIAGADPDDFVIVEPPVTTMVAPSASASYVVAMQAQRAGTRQATLQIPYPGGTVTIALIGTGIGDGDTGDGDKSYYSCVVGGGGGLWPAAIALGVVGLRRRRR